MTQLVALLDANAVIGLAKGDVFNLLPSLYGTIYIPTSVKEEIIVHGQGRAGASELTQALGAWITEVAPDLGQTAPFPSSLSQADRDVLIVALSPARRIDHILADDRHLVREANRLGLTCLRTPDIVILLKAQGLVSRVQTVLDRMRQRGYGVANDIYEKALRAAGEWTGP